MEKEKLNILMEIIILATFRKTKWQVKVKNNLKINAYILVNSWMEKDMDKVNFYGKMETNMKGNGNMIRWMVKEILFLMMVVNIMVHL
jgi:hypothetical protein